MPAPPRVAVRRLRVPDGRVDAVAVRLRAERALAGVELRPRGLPPAAILLVRSLRTRIPEAPASLDALFRTAARPAREAVPAGAPAVLFANRAELLACFAADWCGGVASSRWWWSLVAPGWDPRGPGGPWADAPEAVPAAFARLAERGRAVEFAARLDDALAERLAEAVALVHGVQPAGAGERSRASGPAAASRADPAPEAGAEELSQPQRRLLRLALTLHRAPAALRTGESRPALPPGRESSAPSAVARAAFGAVPGAVSDTASATVSGTVSGTGAAEQPPSPTSARLPAPSRGDTGVGRVEQAPSIAQPTSPERSLAESPLPSEAAAAPSIIDIDPSLPSGDVVRDAATAPTAPTVPAASGRPPEPEAEPLAWRRPVETELGGLLFVLGVAQRLGFYADFTEPATPGIPLDPWRFLTLVGARLVDLDEHAEDALWALLDELARGDDELPPGAELDEYATAVREWIEARVNLPLRAVLERPARIYADETRVDAVFSLDAHPIEIRLAGLDLDPGWIPAAGLALYLHFE